MSRTAKEKYETHETSIALEIDIDGVGEALVDTGIGFLNHMLESFARHSLFNLKLKAVGDLNVDDHHAVEDIGICLGTALSKALGDRKSIRRFGDASVPMDDSLARCAVDIGGRGYLVFNASFNRDTIKGLSSENVEHFLQSMAINAGININLQAEGKNDHHKIEAIFKAAALALRKAVSTDERIKGTVPSTKGSISHKW